MGMWTGLRRHSCSLLVVLRKTKKISAAPVSSFHRRLSSRPEQHIIRSPYPDVIPPNVSLADFIWETVDKFPDNIAMECGVTGRRYTYGEMRMAARRLAASLRKAGFLRGQVLAVVLPNTPEFPIVLLGALEAGLTVTTVNPDYTAGEIARQLLDSGAGGVVTEPEIVGKISEAVKMVGQKLTVVVTPGSKQSGASQGVVDFKEMTASNVDTSNLASGNALRVDDVAVLPYSSGTTGLPKGVKLSHKNLVTNAIQLCDTPRLWVVRPVSSDHQEVVVAVLPFFHVYGLSTILISSLYFGAKIVTLPRFIPDLYLQTIVKHKATVIHLVPPLVQFLGSHPAVKSNHLERIEFITSGAGPIGQSDAERVLDKAPHVNFIQGYGLTETSPVVTLLEKESKNLSSSGKPIPNTEIKVVSLETQQVVGPREVGEIYIRGPQLMLGYHNNPDATADCIDSEGWFHSGDLGYYDEEKHFFIVDRLKELIKVKGFQVAPAELEEILRMHPGVNDVAVIGVPDDRSGEAPKAFVVPKSASLTEKDVQQFLADKVSEHKRLTGGVQFVESIPKNPSGKILRRALKELYVK